MPGFEMFRFVGVKESDLDEFMCGICHEVFNRPLSTLCCGQTYCFECINSWITQKKVCPMDRRPLMSTNLIQPPKALINLLNKLEISCDYQSRGCQTTVHLSDLDKHLKSCMFNPDNYCQTCGLSNDTAHNCIQILKLNVESINDEMKRLRDENSRLKSIIEIKDNMNDRVVVLKSRISEEFEEKIIEISKSALNKCKGSRVEMARNIALQMDIVYGTGWNCFITHGPNYGSVVKAYKNNYLQFRIGSNEIVVYKTSISSLWRLTFTLSLVLLILIYFR